MFAFTRNLYSTCIPKEKPKPIYARKLRLWGWIAVINDVNQYYKWTRIDKKVFDDNRGASKSYFHLNNFLWMVHLVIYSRSNTGSEPMGSLQLHNLFSCCHWICRTQFERPGNVTWYQQHLSLIFSSIAGNTFEWLGYTLVKPFSPLHLYMNLYHYLNIPNEIINDNIFDNDLPALFPVWGHFSMILIIDSKCPKTLCSYVRVWGWNKFCIHFVQNWIVTILRKLFRGCWGAFNRYLSTIKNPQNTTLLQLEGRGWISDRAVLI